MTGGG
jgi:hypothetical protein